MATYPPLVPQEHVDAAKLCMLRQALFEGRVMQRDWFIMGRRALDFAIHQNTISMCHNKYSSFDLWPMDSLTYC